MTISHVATQFKDFSPQTANASMASITPAAGESLILVFNWSDASGDVINSVDDTQGNTWASVGPVAQAGNHRCQIWAAHNVVGAATVVTAHFSAAPDSFQEGWLTRYSTDAGRPIFVDQHAEANGTASAPSSGSKTTQYADELIYGFASGDATVAVGTGFTSRDTTNGNVVEDKQFAGPGSVSADFTNTVNNWVAVMATLSDAAVAPVSRPWVE